MKILYFFSMIILMTVACEAAIDLERTIKQVEKILEENSQLPRLSRDDIMQLLSDIKAEDSKSQSASRELYQSQEIRSSKPYANNATTETIDINENIVDESDKVSLPKVSSKPVETTTKSAPSLMVVLPYTPRDGSTLQELYTRPPRVEVVPVTKVTPKPNLLNSNEKLRETLKTNALRASEQKQLIPADLQAFLDSHGLNGKPGKDNFLLPLEGFKPLPPLRIADETVELPENILLTYDLVIPETNSKKSKIRNTGSQAQFLFEPLRPEFELDTSSSETHEIVLPLDMPKSRKAKSSNSVPQTKPNYDPIEYDSFRVIPLPPSASTLKAGPLPIEAVKTSSNSDVIKRQTDNNITSTPEPSTTTSTTTTIAPEAKTPITNAPPSVDSSASETDAGPSISDLADSFGGAAPEMPGDSQLPPPKKNGFYWMLDWNSFLEVGENDRKVNIRLEPKLGDPQMFLPVTVP